MATDIHELLNSLTLKEKIGQLQQLPPFLYIADLKNEVYGTVRDLGITEEDVFLSGSVLGIRNASEMIDVQKAYLKRSRHQIPLVIMADIIHGYETIFPIPLAMAASFDPEVARKAARIAAIEAQTAGIHVSFAPMADVSRDPRWGRVMEGSGEDVCLAKAFAKATVEGFQHDGIEKIGNMASCVKHFAGYGKVQAGRDYHAVEMSMNEWYNTYLPPYEAALKAGARLVMAAFNTFNGVPASISPFLMRETLRDRLLFDGVTITDYDSLQQVIAHGAAYDQRDAARLGMTAGIDIEMGSATYVKYLESLITEGVIDESLLDQAVLRILELKRDLGLFENPFKGADLDAEKALVRSEAHLQAAEKLAETASVLLRNDNHALPFMTHDTVALIGPYARSRSTNGGWSWHGDIEHNETLEEALIRHKATISLVSDADNKEALSDHDKTMIKAADVVVLAIGEHWRDSGEARSKSMIALDEGQIELVRFAKTVSKRVVVVLYGGRPLVLDDIVLADAVLMTWFLGSRASSVIARTLLGNISPSGKLPMTFPKNNGQIPIHYDHLNTGRPNLRDGNPYVTQYIDVQNEPLYPFGYGLTYADIVIKDLQVDREIMAKGDVLHIDLTLQNNSDVTSEDVVQIYVRDVVSLPVRPVKEMKAFKRVKLSGHQSVVVGFDLGPEAFSYVAENGHVILDSGLFEIHAGMDSQKTIKRLIEMR